MLWLPRLGAGRNGWRLPLADASAAVLADVLAAWPGDELAASTAAALADDPALALWTACRAAALDGIELRSVERLSAWLVRRGIEALTWTEAEPGGPPDAALSAKYADLVRAGVETAELACRLGQCDSQPVADEAYLLGLVHPVREWLALGGLADATDMGRVLPAWLAEAQVDRRGLALETDRAARAVEQAVEIVAGRSEPPPSAGFDRQATAQRAAELGSRWLAAAPGVGHQLPFLAAKLARLARLESSFRQEVEAEKLEAMAEFAAGAGHEINNPLAVISGRAQLLLRQEKDPERRRELALMNSQAMRVHEMISDLMLFARPPRPHPASCDLSQLVDQLVAELAKKAADRQTVLARQGPCEPLVIQADAVQLHVALRAVCDNALNALGRGGHVWLACRRIGPSVSGQSSTPQQPAATCGSEAVEVTIRDDGPGIAPLARGHLFDPFYSGRGSGRGLGLGLSKCWRIVTNHGGRVDVASDPGGGATFTITLPAAGPAPPANGGRS